MCGSWLIEIILSHVSRSHINIIGFLAKEIELIKWELMGHCFDQSLFLEAKSDVQGSNLVLTNNQKLFCVTSTSDGSA